MSKYVSDTAAGKAISAYVILNRNGEHVATVKAHHGNSRCTVNVDCHRDGFQRASASGYGYDKFTAALSGLTIDGHKMTNHCGESLKRPRRGYWLESDKIKRGYKLDNHSTFECATASGYGYDKFTAALAGLTIDGHKMTNHCGESGLRYLEALGYRVFQGI